MNYMILSSKMKGDVIFDHFLKPWFQKDSLDTIGFRTFRTNPTYFFSSSLTKISAVVNLSIHGCLQEITHF